MEVDVNLWAVLFAALSTMVIGSVWYSPSLATGQAWMRLTGHKMDPNFPKGKMAFLLGSAFVASFITAYVLAHMAFLGNKFFDDSFLSDALQAGFWLWLGFTAMRLYVHDAFEGRRKKLTLLNAAHEFVTIMVMALIIGLLKP